MAVDECFNKLKQVFEADENVSEADIKQIVAEFRSIRETAGVQAFIDEATKYQKVVVERAEAVAAREARTAQVYKLNKMDLAAAGKGKGRYWLEAKFGGAAENLQGGNLTVGNYRDVKGNTWKGTLAKRVEDLGIVDHNVLHSPEMSRDIRIELFDITNNKLATASKTGNEAAYEIAKSMNKILNDIRNEYVRLGIPLREVENYIGWQRYDRDKIIKAGESAFIADVLRSTDHKKTFQSDFTDAQKFARAKEMYTHIVSGESIDTTRTRSIHYSSGENANDMMSKYGMYPSAVDSTFAQIDYTARQHALMEVFGPNYKDGFERLKKNIFSKEDIQAFANKAGSPDQMFANATGKTLGGADSDFARTARGARDFTSATLLGGSSISAFFPDMVNATALLHTTNGAGFLNNLKDVLTGYVGVVGRKTEQKAFMNAAGLFAEDLTRNLMEAADGLGDAPGKLSKVAAGIFKWNGMNAHDRAIKTTIVKSFGERLNRLSHLQFDALPDMAKYNMGRYKIGAPEWDVIRQAKFEYGNTKALMPGSLLDNKEINFNGLDQRTVYLKYSSYMNDIANSATLKGDLFTQSLLNLGTSEDTVYGQMLRFMGQFKAAPIQGGRVMKRIAFSNPKFAGSRFGDMQSVATTTAMLTAAGYLTYTAKEFIKGNSPPDPTNIATIRESFIRGGAGAIMGDYVLAEYNKSYRSLIADVAGPAAGKLDTGAKLFASLIRWNDKKGESDIMAHKQEAMRFLVANVPGNNVWWAKMAMEHLVIDSMAEYISPGYTWKQDSRLSSKGQQRIFPSLGVPNDRTILGGE